jgi:hypothetical protein
MAVPNARRVRSGWPARLGWLVAFWLGGVVVMALLAGVLRVLMAWAGMQR